LIFCSSSIGQQIFYNDEDPGNFGTTALHLGYRLYYTIIFKQQIRETYVKMSNKKLQTITHFDFIVYLQITFEKHSILRPLDREELLII